MRGVKLVKLQNISGTSKLNIAEISKHFSFNVKRIFFIESDDKEKRGGHAHRKQKQFFICLKGKCNIFFDNGHEKKNFILDNNNCGIEVENLIWGNQEYLEKGTLLLVLTDDVYSENDYIRDYKSYINKLKNIK